eukprot:CAMPEP_0201165758 /NCGR_PEP_ID=MMETSP0851-20130426/65037_1 /ASSEMBLY_ACC=CAM_ASM_000631 /TAXON_ID=183588 /ORGANISM="Pseudo-nitzschia fraudulenta, Strain WWA7" /LENGTH=34 /DNA_ID= /DNA_START= /DNA_END= /DNA_ORIENTATION=
MSVGEVREDWIKCKQAPNASVIHNPFCQAEFINR